MLNHMILSWQKYLGEKPLKKLTVKTIQVVLVMLAVVAVVVVLLVLVKTAGAVIVNKLTIPLICEHLLFALPFTISTNGAVQF